MSNLFERIAASVPVNKGAGVVTSSGIAWKPLIALTDCYADMPALKPDSFYQDVIAQDSFKDFRGVELGRLKVLGIAAEIGVTKKAAWVCRCKCGSFCTRSSKSLRAGLAGQSNFQGMCEACRYTIRLREGFAPASRHAPQQLKRG